MSFVIPSMVSTVFNRSAIRLKYTKCSEAVGVLECPSDTDFMKTAHFHQLFDLQGCLIRVFNIYPDNCVTA